MKSIAKLIRLIVFVLLFSENPSLRSEDGWVGRRVFLKDSAVIKIGETIVDKYRVLSIPVEVSEVKGESLRVGQYWVKQSDCMNLQEAFVYFDEAVSKNPNSSTAWTSRAIC